MAGLPTGTVTFMFTDIQGSTRLLQELGAAYAALQNAHSEIMRSAIAAGGGHEVSTEGDAFFAVFPSAGGAIEAAVCAQRELHAHEWPHKRPLQVRMGLHTGDGAMGGDNYLSIDVNRAARISGTAHGGQVVISDATRTVVDGSLPPGVAVRDLSRHRLKDLDEPIRLFDLVIDQLPSDFPPLKSLEVPSNLPREHTSFVGRGAEFGKIMKLLEANRLVTLTGAGGSGKTRLALRAGGASLDRFRDGVFFVELEAIEDPDLVPGAIASALGTGELGARPVLETLEIELRDRRLLLILDNFEQVADAAPVVSNLLAAAPGLQVLVTSRGPLRLSGEQEFGVPPLTVPEPGAAGSEDEAMDCEAVALFVERARAIEPGFTLDTSNLAAVIEICRRLDGLPLAIELAASRLRLLPPPAILERLDRSLQLLAGGARDLPPRQRTLRGAIAWSYDLLPDEVAMFFRRACVLSGGFTLPAVEEIAGHDVGVDPFDALESLLDTGLIRRRGGIAEEGRFDVLHVVREFGLELLAQDDDAGEVRRRHAEYFLAFAETAEPGFRGPELLRQIETVLSEDDNIRAALAWGVEQDEGRLGLRIIGALWRFWQLHGDLTEGRRWAERILALPSAQPRDAVRAKALIGLGGLAYWQLAGPPMRNAYNEALEIYREVDDASGIALALYNVAFAKAIAGDVEDAIAMFEDSRARFAALDDRRGVADNLFGLSSVAYRLLNRSEASREAAQEAFDIHRELGDGLGMHGDMYVLGRAVSETGDALTARNLFLETLGIAEAMGFPAGLALSLDNLAYQETVLGRPRRAVIMMSAAEAIKESIGGQAPPELTGLPDQRERMREVLGGEAFSSAWNQGRAMTIPEIVAFARDDT